MKNNRSGQAAIISDIEYCKIKKCIRSKKYKLLFDLARYTGERWGALIQLKVLDVFDEKGNPKEYVTFRAATRKANPNGSKNTRQVPVHPQLKEILEAYTAPNSEYLFPNREGTNPINLRTADLIFRNAVEQAGLEHKGFSTHSTRRTFITRLWERGADIHAIQLTTGHKDLRALSRYVESTPERVKQVIGLL